MNDLKSAARIWELAGGSLEEADSVEALFDSISAQATRLDISEVTDDIDLIVSNEGGHDIYFFGDRQFVDHRQFMDGSDFMAGRHFLGAIHPYIVALRGRRRRNRLLQKQQHRSGQKRAPQWPDPNDIANRVQSELQTQRVTPVKLNGDLVVAAQNFEFLTPEKVSHFSRAYELLIPTAHVWLCSEVSRDGLEQLASRTGYRAFTSVENTRRQAVGFLIHPRLNVLGNPISLDDVASVQGMPDLRPGFVLHVEDPIGGDTYQFCVVHLKSMRGGIAASSAVRYRQNQLLAKHLLGPVIVGGDFNCFLDRAPDIDPLKQAGILLLDPGDTRATHAMGGRLDGFATRGLARKTSHIQLLPWFKTVGREFTDHATVRVRIRQ